MSSFDTIVHVGACGCVVHPATVAAARALVFARLQRATPCDVPGWTAYLARQAWERRLPGTPCPYPVPAEPLARALKDLAVQPVGTLSLALAQVSQAALAPRQAVAVTADWKAALAQWALTAKRASGGTAWTAKDLNESHPERRLLFLSGLRQRARGNPVIYFDSEEVHRAHALAQLLKQADSGSPDEVSEVLLSYVKWLNRHSDADEIYMLGRLSEATARQAGLPGQPPLRA